MRARPTQSNTDHFQSRTARSASSGRRRVATSVLSGRRPMVLQLLSFQTLAVSAAFLLNAASLVSLAARSNTIGNGTASSYGCWSHWIGYQFKARGTAV